MTEVKLVYLYTKWNLMKLLFSYEQVFSLFFWKIFCRILFVIDVISLQNTRVEYFMSSWISNGMIYTEVLIYICRLFKTIIYVCSYFILCAALNRTILTVNFWRIFKFIQSKRHFGKFMTKKRVDDRTVWHNWDVFSSYLLKWNLKS